MVILMLLNCKQLTIPLHIAMVETVINPYDCDFIITLWLNLYFVNCSTVKLLHECYYLLYTKRL